MGNKQLSLLDFYFHNPLFSPLSFIMINLKSARVGLSANKWHFLHLSSFPLGHMWGWSSLSGLMCYIIYLFPDSIRSLRSSEADSQLITATAADPSQGILDVI